MTVVCTSSPSPWGCSPGGDFVLERQQKSGERCSSETFAVSRILRSPRTHTQVQATALQNVTLTGDGILKTQLCYSEVIKEPLTGCDWCPYQKGSLHTSTRTGSASRENQSPRHSEEVPQAGRRRQQGRCSPQTWLLHLGPPGCRPGAGTSCCRSCPGCGLCSGQTGALVMDARDRNCSSGPERGKRVRNQES